MQGDRPIAREGDSIDPETRLRQALTVVWQAGARSLELRPAVSLGRPLQQCGELKAARGLPAPACGRFDAGFETVDLKSAKYLLGDLSFRA